MKYITQFQAEDDEIHTVEINEESEDKYSLTYKKENEYKQVYSKMTIPSIALLSAFHKLDLFRRSNNGIIVCEQITFTTPTSRECVKVHREKGQDALTFWSSLIKIREGYLRNILAKARNNKKK